MNASEVVVRVAGRALGIDPQAEIAGEIIAAGDSAREWLGRRVVVPRCLPCGDCDRCRRGRAASCPERWPRRSLGAEETVPARFLCSLEPPLWPSDWDASQLWRAAALADAASTPYAALARAGLGPGDWLAVIGDGARAVLACAIARAKGAQSVAISSGDPVKDEQLTLAGAAVLSAASAPSELSLPGIPEVVLETTGSSAGRHRALAMLPPGATALFLDGPVDAVPVPQPDWHNFVGHESKLLGAEAAHPDLLPEVCALFARGELPIASLVTAVEPTQMEETLALRRKGLLPQLPIVRFH
jgi:threonine dehydrogenase-like Zn-dependent dehydrogenase